MRNHNEKETANAAIERLGGWSHLMSPEFEPDEGIFQELEKVGISRRAFLDFRRPPRERALIDCAQMLYRNWVSKNRELANLQDLPSVEKVKSVIAKHVEESEKKDPGNEKLLSFKEKLNSLRELDYGPLIEKQLTKHDLEMRDLYSWIITNDRGYHSEFIKDIVDLSNSRRQSSE